MYSCVSPSSDKSFQPYFPLTLSNISVCSDPGQRGYMPFNAYMSVKLSAIGPRPQPNSRSSCSLELDQYKRHDTIEVNLLQRVTAWWFEWVWFLTYKRHVGYFVPQILAPAFSGCVMIGASVADPCEPFLVLHAEVSERFPVDVEMRRDALKHPRQRRNGDIWE